MGIMERYKNLGGDSGVLAYEIGQKAITVPFKNGSAYLYTRQSASMANLAEMQRLAVAGHGLSSFINRVVSEVYEQIIR
jgi:glycine cleavage system aminomethyltransferase T